MTGVEVVQGTEKKSLFHHYKTVKQYSFLPVDRLTILEHSIKFQKWKPNREFSHFNFSKVYDLYETVTIFFITEYKAYYN